MGNAAGSAGASVGGIGGATAAGGVGAAAGLGPNAGANGAGTTGAMGGVGATNSAAGMGGLGGAGVVAGAAGGGGGPTGGAGSGDEFVSGVTVAVHEEVNTILVVTWTQTVAASETLLEFTFENGEVLRSRAKPGALGAHSDVVLGVPGQTLVTVRVVSRQAGVDYKTRDYQGTTGAVPSGLPRPQVTMYNPALASPERWMLAAVENSDGGCTTTACYYHTTFWVYIMDRQGRIVWYYSDPASNATSSFQRIAKDGEYIWIEKRPFGGSGTRGVLKTTLDWSYHEEVPVPNLSDCIDVTLDGSLLYDVGGASPQLREMNAAGTVRNIWNCRTHFGAGFACYSNTVNWNARDNTVLMSFPEERTVIEINRQTGSVVGQYGAATGSYTFQPNTWGFGYQHFANITPAGTLLVSSHMPGYENTRMPVANQHAFMEFDIDRTNRRLVERWIYNSGPEWAMFKGMAIRLANGNTLGNYGTGGVIREITPDKQTVFHVKFDVATGNDFFNKMVGHNELVADLYALNGGPN